SQVRVMSSAQGPMAGLLLVTVPNTVIVTLVPQQASVAEGGSKLQVLPHSTVLLVAQVKTGGCVATAVTVWLQVALLLQQSVACQVAVAEYEQSLPVVTMLETMACAGTQQPPEALGGSKLHVLPHSTVLLVAQVKTSGA